MNVYAAFTLLATAACAWVAAVVFRSDSKAPLNRVFGVASSVAAYMLFYYFMCLQADNAATVYLWLKISLGWYFITPLFLHFILIFTGKKILKKRFILYPILYGPALFFAIVNLVSDVFIGEPYRYDFGGYSPYEIPQNVSWLWYVMIGWIITLAIIGIIFCVHHHLRQRDPLKKRVSGAVLVSFALPIIITVVEESLIMFGIRIRIPVLDVFSVVWLIAWIGYAIRKYDLFKIDPLKAAENVMATIPDAVFFTDHLGLVVGVNGVLPSWLGVTESEIVGRPVRDLFEAGPVNDAICVEILAAHRVENAEGGLHLARDGDRRTGNGKFIPVLISASPLVRRGTTIGMVCVGKEIIERKRFEEMLLELNARLQRSNRELQEFSSIASHDLQAPLRKISLFSDRLRESCPEVCRGEGAEYLVKIEESTRRMQRLITDLLAFARVINEPGRPVVVGLDGVLRDVLADLELQIRESGADIGCGSLPAVTADPTHLRQLFQNLVGNALKFHAPGHAPHVRIFAVGGAPAGSAAVAVEDDGIGIEPDQQEKVFGTFQRLHGREQYEGNGLGLAVCKRIVERYGGTISLKSRPGAGAVFTVVLPAG